jgi:hypothetical protein
MIFTLPFLSIFLWLVMIVGQVTVSFITYREKLQPSRYRCFRAFLYFATVKSICLFMVASFMKPHAYFWVYYAGCYVSCLLIAAAIAEVYRNIFGPAFTLPKWVPRNVALRLPLAVTFSAAITALFQIYVRGGTAARALASIEQALITACGLSLFMMMIYSKVLGMIWPKRVAGIAMGFVLFLMINMASFFLKDLTVYSSPINWPQIGQLSYIISLALWGNFLLQKEVIADRASLDLARTFMLELTAADEALHGAN